MDALSIILAAPNAETLRIILGSYLLPVMLYCVTSAMAFLALRRRSRGTVLVSGLLIFALPIVGPLLVLGREATRPASPSA